MRQLKISGIYTLGILFVFIVVSSIVVAGGPPLKDNACGSCHKDYNTIMPKNHPDAAKGAACMTCHTSDAAKNEATKFSTLVHKVHQNGKTKQECSACHAL